MATKIAAEYMKGISRVGFRAGARALFLIAAVPAPSSCKLRRNPRTLAPTARRFEMQAERWLRNHGHSPTRHVVRHRRVRPCSGIDSTIY